MGEAGRMSVVSDGDGVVRLGIEPIGACGVAAVPLPGCTLLVDPSDPDPAAHALVYDQDAATPTLAALFGTAVADAVAAGDAAEVEWCGSPELAEAEHLGRLLWLGQNPAVPLDRALLEFETAVAAGVHEDDEPAIERPEHLLALATVARATRQDPGLPLAAQLRELVRKGLAQLPVTERDHPDLIHERELLAVEDAWGSVTVDRADLAWLAAQVSPSAANMLGDDASDHGERVRGTASLDWERVPSQLVPASEPEVRFDVKDGWVRVRLAGALPVVAHPAIPRRERRLPRLVASLRSTAWPLPLAEGELTYDSGLDQWSGRFEIVQAAVELARTAPVLDVDVRSAVLEWTAPNLRRQRSSAAGRWCARGIELIRLGTFNSDLAISRAGSGALRYASRLWQAAGSAERAGRCRELAATKVTDVRLALSEQWLATGGGGASPWPSSAGA